MLIASLRNDLREKSFLVGADIDRYFTQRVHDVKVLSQADVLEGDNIPSIIQYLTEVIQETPYLDDIDIINTSGIVIASSGEQNESGKHVLELYPELNNLFRDSQQAQQGDIFVSNILELDSGPGLAFLTPITDDDNIEVVKTLLVEINLDIIRKIVSDFDERVIGNKFVYLVDNDGRVIVTADESVPFLGVFPDLFTQKNLLSKFSDQGEVGSVIYNDAAGDVVMAGFADMAEFGINKAMDWSIIAVAPLEEIAKPVVSFQRTLLLFTLLAFLLSSFFLFITGRRILTSVNVLVDGARRVGGGELGFRIKTSTNDEFSYLAFVMNETLEKLVSAQEEAKLANVTKSEFLAAMSHEIRTPMAGIIGMSDLLVRSELNAQQLSWMRSIIGSSHGLLHILNEILDQSKLEAGKMEIDNQDFHLSAFLDGVMKLFVPKIDSKSISYSIEIDSDVPEGICADSSRISQILSNLISNALKFTESGRISVSVSEDKIETGVKSSSDVKATRLGEEVKQLRISVNDTGIGISDEVQTTLFSAFSQADNTTSRTYGGTGLGLSISKQLAELMGGEIGVKSVEGVGSQFWFTVIYTPTSGPVELPVENSHSAYWTASRRLNILLAEDTPVIQQLVATIFEDLNHRVSIAANGKIVVEMLENEDFDLILMDVRMPVMDGMEATRRIRAMESDKSNISIIALTADISSGNIHEYFDSGVNDVCAKPVEIEVLLHAINTQLGEVIHRSKSFLGADDSLVIDRNRRSTDKKVEPEYNTSLTHCEEEPQNQSFSQILEQVSTLLDQTSTIPVENNALQSNIRCVNPEKLTALQNKYENELVQDCDILNRKLESLMANPSDVVLMQEMKGITHTLKGAGKTFGYDLITLVATDADMILKTTIALTLNERKNLRNHFAALSFIAERKITGESDIGRTLLQGLKDCSELEV